MFDKIMSMIIQNFLFLFTPSIMIKFLKIAIFENVWKKVLLEKHHQLKLKTF